MRRLKWMNVFASFSFLLTGLLLIGCATGPKSIVKLEVDKHSNDMYKAVLFGRVNIHSRSEKLSDNYLRMEIWKKNVQPAPGNIMNFTWDISDELRKNNSVDKLFVLEVAPGDYELRAIVLDRLSYEPHYGFFPKPEDISKPQHLFSVPPNSLTYLGTIDISLDRLEYLGLSPLKIWGTDKRIVTKIDGYYEFKYTMQFLNNLESDSLSVKNKYPALYEKYKGNTKLAF